MVEVDVFALDQIKTNTGQDLLSMTKEKPVLLIFLRHFGCVFCQQALKDIHKLRKELESKGVTFVTWNDSEIEKFPETGKG